MIYSLYPIYIVLIASFISFYIKKEVTRSIINSIIGSISIPVSIINVTHYMKYGSGNLITFKYSHFIAIQMDIYSALFSVMVCILWVLAYIYGEVYMHKNYPKYDTRIFFGFFNISIVFTLLIAQSANAITMFMFYECLTLSTIPLICFKPNDQVRFAIKIYLGNLFFTSICFLLPAAILTQIISNSQFFSPNGSIDQKYFGFVPILIFLYVFGIGKIALIPFNKWLPAAMVAPTPVSSLLHAVAVVKAGAFCMFRFAHDIVGVELLYEYTTKSFLSGNWFVYLAGGTIIISSFIAANQDHLKKRLAFSTISQLGYISLAISMGTKIALIAGFIHIFSHALGKIILFFSAGHIYTLSHKSYISEFQGIGRKMKVTFFCFSIGSLSMIGFPLTAGFVSKWMIIEAAFDVNNYFVLFVMIVATILNCYYFLPIIFKAFGRQNIKDENICNIRENLIMNIVISIISILNVAFFIIWYLIKFVVIDLV